MKTTTGKFDSFAKGTDAGVLYPVYFNELPFVPVRAFLVAGMDEIRGGHAHRTARQLITPVHGNIECMMIREMDVESVRLAIGDWVLVEPMTWLEVYPHVEFVTASFLCFADKPYDKEDYIYDKRIFMDGTYFGE